MEKDIDFKNVLSAFANYGFRKASMEDLARAAGVSRQTLYNRFRNKETVLDWAVAGFTQDIRERAAAELLDPDVPLADCLINAFSRLTGDHVALLHDSPHGAEIMEMGMDALRRADGDPEERFERSMAEFLLARGVCHDPVKAGDMAFMLFMSAKGLFLKTRTVEEFQAGMARIVAVATSLD